jgi:hypothetical protein
MLTHDDLMKMAMDEEPQSLQVPELMEQDKRKPLRKVYDAAAKGIGSAAGLGMQAIQGLKSLDKAAPMRTVD